MSHLLSTVNPQAAAEILPDVDENDTGAPDPARESFVAGAESELVGAVELPGVGASVKYIPTQGYGRNGMAEFAALVTRVRKDEGTLDLIVFYDAGDLIDEIRVPARSEKDQHRCWEMPENAVVRTVDERLRAPAGLAGELAALRNTVLGDFDPPRISIIDIMQDFETRLRDVKQQVSHVQEASGIAPLPKNAKTPRKRG